MSIDSEADDTEIEEVLSLATVIVSAFVSRNSVSQNDLPDLIRSVHQSLKGLGHAAPVALEERPKPAVPINKSIQHDFIVCLEDGKKFKSLKRHLSAEFGLTPEEYRAKWGLPADYPMVAPNYAAARSQLAKKMGLGKKPRARAH